MPYDLTTLLTSVNNLLSQSAGRDQVPPSSNEDVPCDPILQSVPNTLQQDQANQNICLDA